jgi:hypothetical protein
MIAATTAGVQCCGRIDAGREALVRDHEQPHVLAPLGSLSDSASADGSVVALVNTTLVSDTKGLRPGSHNNRCGLTNVINW